MFSDLRSIAPLTDQTLIAVKAPLNSASSIEVSDPLETRVNSFKIIKIIFFKKFEIFVRNEQGEALQAFLCPESTDKQPTEFAPV